jgi:hypothetical protein
MVKRSAYEPEVSVRVKFHAVFVRGQRGFGGEMAVLCNHSASARGAEQIMALVANSAFLRDAGSASVIRMRGGSFMPVTLSRPFLVGFRICPGRTTTLCDAHSSGSR